MKIGSFLKNSFIDYPGIISTVIGTQGCNLSCPWCHNSHLIPLKTKKAPLYLKDEFFDFLARRKNILDGVVITGGEPTLHEDLPNYCNIIKNMGFSIKLDTNGTHPAMVRRLIRSALIDYIAMDIKTDFIQYERLFRTEINADRIAESIEIIISSNTPYEFRTTCVSPFVSIDNIDKIAATIKGAEKYILQKCKPIEAGFSPIPYDILSENQISELLLKAKLHVKNCYLR